MNFKALKIAQLIRILHLHRVTVVTYYSFYRDMAKVASMQSLMLSNPSSADWSAKILFFYRVAVSL